ncbi:MAG TPA: GntR family transcriptional regulator [Thermomicrobiales bacterium]|nr:GntR family transcriptional regulator [Thermomicrobiales bacterium]
MSRQSDLATILSPAVSHGLGVDIADRLRIAILNGSFGPGERLPEELLAKAMGVSRGPVREALVQLEREGLIVIQRNRGAFVAQLSLQDLDEVYTLRVALERLATEQSVIHATESELDEVQVVIDEIATRMGDGMSVRDAAELDLAFHDIIYRVGKHKRLYETWSMLRPQIQVLLLNRNLADDDFHELVISTHQDILDALRVRDSERAVALTMEHLLDSYDRVRRSIQVRGTSRPLPLANGEADS